MTGVHYGIHAAMEAEADAIIFGSLRGVTSQEAKSDILTPWKEYSRRSKEVMSSTGVVDPSIRRGIYHRKANPQHPHLNSRDGHYPARRIPSGDQGYKTRVYELGDED
jgi:hypothetical protein